MSDISKVVTQVNTSIYIYMSELSCDPLMFWSCNSQLKPR